MAIQVKELTLAAPDLDKRAVAPIVDDLQNHAFNVIPATTASNIYDLYTVPVAKAAVVKSIRLINSSPSQLVKVNLYFMRLDSASNSRRRQICPVDLALAPGSMYVDDGELTLEAGDLIQGKCDTPYVLQYFISGI